MFHFGAFGRRKVTPAAARKKFFPPTKKNVSATLLRHCCCFTCCHAEFAEDWFRHACWTLILDFIQSWTSQINSFSARERQHLKDGHLRPKQEWTGMDRAFTSKVSTITSISLWALADTALICSDEFGFAAQFLNLSPSPSFHWMVRLNELWWWSFSSFSPSF